jgi:hypothetical protein
MQALSPFHWPSSRMTPAHWMLCRRSAFRVRLDLGLHAMAEVASATAKIRLVQLADEIISVLSSDPNASVKVTVEIAADFPDGAAEQVKRAVSEGIVLPSGSPTRSSCR